MVLIISEKMKTGKKTLAYDKGLFFIPLIIGIICLFVSEKSYASIGTPDAIVIFPTMIGCLIALSLGLIIISFAMLLHVMKKDDSSTK